MKIIECKDLTIGYDNRIVRENINFDVEQGDYLCIIGDNGSGKTTLLKTLLGLIKPIKGVIKYSDEDKKKSIGYLPQQNGVDKDFPASIYEIVLSGRQNQGKLFYDKFDKELAIAMIEKLGLKSKMKSSFKELSGGQKQRTLLARALCAAGDILILDEPVTGLDVEATEELYNKIDELNKEGMTIIMITHDIPEALTRANKLLELDTPIFFGSIEEYKERKRAEYE